jgi:hypothetical protein
MAPMDGKLQEEHARRLEQRFRAGDRVRVDPLVYDKINGLVSVPPRGDAPWPDEDKVLIGPCVGTIIEGPRDDCYRVATESGPLWVCLSHLVPAEQSR